MIQLPDDWQASERCNTWLTDGENHVAWLDLPGTKQKLEVAITSDNYPGLQIAILSEQQSTDEHLAAHIKDKCDGWFVRRCNVEGIEVVDDCVLGNYSGQ